MPLLLLIFIAVPVLEIYLLIKVGGVIGAFPTIAIVILTAIIGTWLLRQQEHDGFRMGDGVGTVYGTSVATTILRLPYARVPIHRR